ncbi:Putative carboxylesterase 1 [Glycine soja]|uniref:Putative carboxylesterase 1 n=1 Tax=Glycine soja TaxID=3848 RepID=A0A0B2P7A8_GLYSO|nr:Putative carboxylesterase 1 [Glycine soja]
MGTLIRIFSDGTIERPLQTPFVPLKLDEPHTGLSSKDVVISHNLPVSALVYLPKLTNEADKVPILVYFHGGGLLQSIFFQHVTMIVGLHSSGSPPIIILQRIIPPIMLSHGDFNRVFIGGDSAGGNIAHNILMRAGTEALPGDIKILGAILFILPFVDQTQLGLTGLGCSRMIACVAGKDSLRERGVSYYESVKKSGWQGKLEFFEEKDEGHVYQLFNVEATRVVVVFVIAVVLPCCTASPRHRKRLKLESPHSSKALIS